MKGAEQTTGPVTEPTKPALTAGALVQEVRARYPRPEWHCEAEMTLDRRRLDVVAFNLWGARGYRIVGFEVKVSRGDWLRELAAFEKSAEWHAVVDAFYVVTPAGLVQPDELPAGWGLRELRGSRMFTKVQAAARAPRPDLPRELSARFLGRTLDLIESLRRQQTAEIRHEVRASIEVEVEERLRREFGGQLEQVEKASSELKALREALGARYWDSPEELRALVVLARSVPWQGAIVQGRQVADMLLRHADHLTQASQNLLTALEQASVQAGEVAHGG